MAISPDLSKHKPTSAAKNPTLAQPAPPKKATKPPPKTPGEPANRRTAPGALDTGQPPEASPPNRQRAKIPTAALPGVAADIPGGDDPPSGESPPQPNPRQTEQRIAKEARRIKSRLKGLDKNKLDTAAPLIRNAARLTVAIDDIWDDYFCGDLGYVEEYDNGGGQKGRKPSEARKAINEMTKHHIAIMRILIELAPPAQIKRDALDDILDM